MIQDNIPNDYKATLEASVALPNSARDAGHFCPRRRGDLPKVDGQISSTPRASLLYMAGKFAYRQKRIARYVGFNVFC